MRPSFGCGEVAASFGNRWHDLAEPQTP